MYTSCTCFQFTVPWLSFVKSPAVWAIVMMHMCANWTTYTFLTNMPTYIKEVLKFDVKSVATVYNMLSLVTVLLVPTMALLQ